MHGPYSFPLAHIIIVFAIHCRNCEFLHKLDLTMNFVDVDELAASITHLQSRERLRDLYMMGNPSQANWPNFNNYVIAMLPQLENLDGTEITKSMRIIARQHLAEYEVPYAVVALSCIRAHSHDDFLR